MANQSEKWQILSDMIHKHQKELYIRTFRDLLNSSHVIEKYLDDKLSVDGVNRTQRMIILHILAKREPMTPTEISKITLHNIDTINKSIDGLDKLGITRSYQSKRDRRIRKVILTEKGLELAEKTLPARYIAFSKAMSCFKKGEARIFESFIKRLNENIRDIMAKESPAFRKSGKDN